MPRRRGPMRSEPMRSGPMRSEPMRSGPRWLERSLPRQQTSGGWQEREWAIRTCVSCDFLHFPLCRSADQEALDVRDDRDTEGHHMYVMSPYIWTYGNRVDWALSRKGAWRFGHAEQRAAIGR